jgi:hypothetical protein
MKILSAAVLLALALTAQALAPDTPVPASVEMHYCGLKPGHAPLKSMSFDITLHNFSDKPQWFLLPAALYDKPVAEHKGAGINGMNLYADSQRKIIVVDFWGEMHLQANGAGFRGLFLPAGATFSIHNFMIRFMGEPSSPLAIKVVLADRIKFIGTWIEQWLAKRLLKAQTADVKELHSDGWYSAPDSGPFPVNIVKSGEFTLPDAMAQRCVTQAP